MIDHVVCSCRAQVFAQTVRDKGPAGLFTGMGPRVTQTALMSAVFFSLFEFWKGQLKRCASLSSLQPTEAPW